jgi:type 1 glutamine amidotransferase
MEVPRMTRSARCLTVAALCFCATLPLHAAGQPAVKITPEWKATMRGLMPEKPRVTPRSPRTVLLFSLTTGYRHWVIPHTDVIVELLGEKTGAFEVVKSTDVGVFERASLTAFDAVILNNNCSRGPGRNLFLDVLGYDTAKAAALEKNLIDFVAGGKGLTLIHGAIVCLNNSPAFSAMVGGSFDFHPPQQEVTLNLVEPSHPLLAAFKGKPLVHIDEPYLFKNAYTRKNFRPLLVMDTSTLKCGRRQKDVVADIRYCAWIKKHGKGRVFYCSPSHNAQSFEDPRLLRFLLDGIQYTLGDFPCDDTPKTPGGAAGSG